MTAGASAPQGGVRVIFQSGSRESQNSQWVSFLQAAIQGRSVHGLGRSVLPQAGMCQQMGGLIQAGRTLQGRRGEVWLVVTERCSSFLHAPSTRHACDWHAVYMSLKAKEPAAPASTQHLQAGNSAQQASRDMAGEEGAGGRRARSRQSCPLQAHGIEL